jgi:hypothetical protein
MIRAHTFLPDVQFNFVAYSPVGEQQETRSRSVDSKHKHTISFVV